MMGVCSPPKVPTWVWSFLIKMGILALGVVWVILIKFPASHNQNVPDEAPVPSPQIPDRFVESSEPSEFMPLSASSRAIRSPASDHVSPKMIPERVAAQAGSSSLLNVNTATQEELERLPGLGTVLAQRILAYRQANGPFRQVEELQKVPGIGHKRLQQLRPLIRMATKKA